MVYKRVHWPCSVISIYKTQAKQQINPWHTLPAHLYAASTPIMEGCLVWLSGQSDIRDRQTSLIKLQREEKAKECTQSQIRPDLTTAMHLGSFSLLLTTNSQRQETAGRERKEIKSVSPEDRTNYRAHSCLDLENIILYQTGVRFLMCSLDIEIACRSSHMLHKFPVEKGSY